MPRAILTDIRVKALRPRGTACDIRDANLKGFAVRVLPSGCKRYFVHCQHRGERFRKIVGDAETVGTDEARSCAVRTFAAMRRKRGRPAISPGPDSRQSRTYSMMRIVSGARPSSTVFAVPAKVFQRDNARR